MVTLQHPFLLPLRPPITPGKVDLDKMLGMKDTVIEELRTEVDLVRKMNIDLIDGREKMMDEQRKMSMSMGKVKKEDDKSDGQGE
ncbi:hypothetical protein EON63_22910, partial [archaeon]